jgi:hypothetical protein
MQLESLPRGIDGLECESNPVPRIWQELEEVAGNVRRLNFRCSADNQLPIGAS